MEKNFHWQIFLYHFPNMPNLFHLCFLLLQLSKYYCDASVINNGHPVIQDMTNQLARREAMRTLAQILILSICSKRPPSFDDFKSNTHLHRLLGEKVEYLGATLREIFEQTSILGSFSKYRENDLMKEVIRDVREMLKKDYSSIEKFIDKMPYINHEIYEEAGAFFELLFEWYHRGSFNVEEGRQVLGKIPEDWSWSKFIRLNSNKRVVKKFDFLMAYIFPPSLFISNDRFITVKNSLLKLILQISVRFFNSDLNPNFKTREMGIFINHCGLKKYSNILIFDSEGNPSKTLFRISHTLAKFMKYLSTPKEQPRVEFLELLRFPGLEVYLSSGFDRLLKEIGDAFHKIPPHTLFSICNTAAEARVVQISSFNNMDAYPLAEIRNSSSPTRYSFDALSSKHRELFLTKLNEQFFGKSNTLHRLSDPTPLVYIFPDGIRLTCFHYPNISDRSLLDLIPSLSLQNLRISIPPNNKERLFGFILRKVSVHKLTNFQVLSFDIAKIQNEDQIFLIHTEFFHEEIFHHFEAITYRFPSTNHREYLLCYLEDHKGFGFEVSGISHSRPQNSLI
jgi:hypothetical protein